MSGCGFGIDGGGTRSRLRVFDWETGAEIRRLTGESTNLYSVGVERALSNTLKLLTDAGVPFSDYRGGCFGSAGLSRPRESALLRAFFERHLPGCPVRLCNDGEILLCGSLKSGSGYCLIAGTGSLALGRADDGRTVRAGGLGYMLGDEGSALWIGWQAVMRALRAQEGRDLDTCLLPKLLAHFSLKQSDDFVQLMHERFEKKQIASAAACVLEEAERDPLARDIARQAVRELSLLVQSVVSRLPLSPMRVALSGGVLENNAFLRDQLIRALTSRYPEMSFITGQGDALLGACLLAREQGK